MNTETFITELDNLFRTNQLEAVEPYLVQTLETAKKAEDYGLYITVANEMIGYYRSISQFRKAFDISEDVLLLMEELQLGETEYFATTLLNTATAYSYAGQLEAAYEYYQKALRIYERTLPKGDYRFAGLYNNMSMLLSRMERDAQAISCLEKALAIVSEIEGTELDRATTLTNLGLIYFKQKQNEQAKEVLTQALQLFEQAGAENASHYSAALAGMGEAYYHDGEFDKALAIYEKSLAHIRKHYGDNTQGYAIVCENCAAVCEQMGKSDKAMKYREQAAAIYQTLQQQMQE